MIPSSVYRLQMREGMDFARAERLLPYLERLGAGALYLSPIFTAVPGSTHGYDVTDPGEVEPGLGGREGLERLSAAARSRGMGLVIDIVPNHMAFAPQNVWLRDVLRHGRESRFFGHFDILQMPLPLPWLAAPLDEIEVGADPDGPVLVAGDLRVPLAPGTEGLPVPEMIEAQAWRLVPWQEPPGHRRFFDVTGLIGLRIEDREVFEDVHRLTFDLVRSGVATGLRVDHVDGLAFPAEYMARLREAVGDAPVWVEKIRSPGEALPDWPVEGTTGYGAAASIGRVMAGPGLEALDAEWRARTGRAGSFEDEVARAKGEMLEGALRPEMDRLTAMTEGHLEGDASARREALRRFVVAMPRYRSYGADDPMVAEVAGAAGTPGMVELAGAQPALWARVEQLTGAAIATAQENTAFFRHAPLLALAEVGAEPEVEPAEITRRAFHSEMEERARTVPNGIVLGSTHDTKRSEDARARILAASHAPDAFLAWMAALPRAPEPLQPDGEWYAAQTALALPMPAPERAARIAEHLVKAFREGKEISSHVDPDRRAERAARAHAAALAGVADDPALDAIAARLTLVQTALKLTVPGIPDVYQGNEAMAWALTDPDNRRPPDWDALEAALDGGDLPEPGRAKMALTRALLHLRRERPDVCAAPYERAEAPRGVLAFRRGPLWVAVAPMPAGRVEAPEGETAFGSVEGGMADLEDGAVAVVLG